MTRGPQGRRAWFRIRKELGFSKDEFQALSWSDQRMYLEQIVIDDYLLKKQRYDNMDEEQQWQEEEPVPPDVYLRDESLSYIDERNALPDILDM